MVRSESASRVCAGRAWILRITRMLTQDDFKTPTWQRIDALVNKRIEELRRQNDADLDERKTAEVRGAIKELKKLLGLAEQRPGSHTARPER